MTRERQTETAPRRPGSTPTVAKAPDECAGFVIALLARSGERMKNYLCRKSGRTLLLPDRSIAAVYRQYRTAHMIAIKAAVHYDCVACVEEL